MLQQFIEKVVFVVVCQYLYCLCTQDHSGQWLTWPMPHTAEATLYRYNLDRVSGQQILNLIMFHDRLPLFEIFTMIYTGIYPVPDKASKNFIKSMVGHTIPYPPHLRPHCITGLNMTTPGPLITCRQASNCTLHQHRWPV